MNSAFEEPFQKQDLDFRGEVMRRAKCTLSYFETVHLVIIPFELEHLF